MKIKFFLFFKRSLYDFTRGNSPKLAKLHVFSERERFFTNRVINIWNALPDSIVTSSSFSSFKRNIAQFDLFRYLLFYWSYVCYTCTIVYKGDLLVLAFCQPWSSYPLIDQLMWLLAFLLLYLCMFIWYYKCLNRTGNVTFMGWIRKRKKEKWQEQKLQNHEISHTHGGVTF